MMKRFKIILYAFGFCSLGIWFYAAYLYNSFVLNPTLPIESTGQTVSFQARGKTVYITNSQQTTYDIAFYTSIAGFVIYATAYTILRKRIDESTKT